jgi:hypothetical protein
MPKIVRGVAAASLAFAVVALGAGATAAPSAGARTVLANRVYLCPIAGFTWDGFRCVPVGPTS